MGKLYRIIRVGNECHHTYPWEREAEGDFTTDGRGEGNVTTETNWNDATISQEMAVATRCWKRQGAGSALEPYSLDLALSVKPISDCLLPELGGNKFLFF